MSSARSVEDLALFVRAQGCVEAIRCCYNAEGRLSVVEQAERIAVAIEQADGMRAAFRILADWGGF